MFTLTLKSYAQWGHEHWGQKIQISYEHNKNPKPDCVMKHTPLCKGHNDIHGNIESRHDSFIFRALQLEPFATSSLSSSGRGILYHRQESLRWFFQATSTPLRILQTRHVESARTLRGFLEARTSSSGGSWTWLEPLPLPCARMARGAATPLPQAGRGPAVPW